MLLRNGKVFWALEIILCAIGENCRRYLKQYRPITNVIILMSKKNIYNCFKNKSIPSISYAHDEVKSVITQKTFPLNEQVKTTN